MLVRFISNDFLKVNIDDVVDNAANCSGKPPLMLLSIRLSIGNKAPTKKEENTSMLNISRVLECTGYLHPGEKFQLCFDHILDIVSLGLNATMPPVPPTVDIGEKLLPYISTVLLALLLVAILLAILVKKRRPIGVAIANRMHTLVW